MIPENVATQADVSLIIDIHITVFIVNILNFANSYTLNVLRTVQIPNWAMLFFLFFLHLSIARIKKVVKGAEKIFIEFHNDRSKEEGGGVKGDLSTKVPRVTSDEVQRTLKSMLLVKH